MAELRVCLTCLPVGWQDRRLVTVQLLYLIFVRLTGWMARLAHSATLKDASASACGFGYSLAPAAGLYVAVRGVGRVAARSHVHIADSVAMAKPVQ
jgi:hypothetical protein